MDSGLTFEQVKQARVFAWHERHYLFVDDTLLRVIPRYPNTDDDAGRPLEGMVVRRSALRGTEHLLDDGWHHLPDCPCRFCSARTDEADHAAESSGCCGRPTQ
jgi:hypothetical protein